MKKLLVLVCILGILAAGSTAIAADLPQYLNGDEVLILTSFLFMLCIYFIIWIIASIVCGVAAHRKGLTGFGFFLLSCLTTPIIGFLAVIAMHPKIRK